MLYTSVAAHELENSGKHADMHTVFLASEKLIRLRSEVNSQN